MKKNIIRFIIPLAAIPLLANCGGGGTDTTHYVTFHQELASDVKLPFNSKTTDSEIIAQEPAIVEKDGYDARWEDYTVVGKKEDFTVNAIYTAQTYYVTFKSKGTVVDTVPFTKADIKGEHSQLPSEKTPACPQDGWWKYHWEDYSLSLNNITVNAVAGELVQHKAIFKDGDKTIGDPVNFTREDIGTDYILPTSKIPDAVKNYKHDPAHPTYWDNNWDFKVPEGAGETVTFDAKVSKHNFDLKFVDFDGEQVGEIVHYNFDTDWATLVKPAAPTKDGYTTGWPTTITWSCDPDNAQVVEPTSTANKYTITFVGHEDSPQEVTYGSAYTLDFASETNNDIKMWHDGDAPVATSGTWNISHDVILELKPVIHIDFNNGYIPRFMSTQQLTNSNAANSMQIVDNPDGGKMLEISVNNSADSAYLVLSKQYMEQSFALDGVAAIEFDAKATVDSSNFRARYKAYNSSKKIDELFNNPYENALDNLGLGLSKDRFKTFSFRKEYFTDKDSGNDLKFMYGNFGHTGEKVYINNIRLSDQSEIDYAGFEGGGLNTVDGGNWYQFFYNTGGRGDNRVPHYIATRKFMMVMDEKKTSDKSVTLSNEIHNGGITSLKVHKTIPSGASNSAFPMYLQGITNPVYDKVESVTFDIYCSSRYNGNSIKDGKSNTIPGFGSTDFHEANTWYTMTLQINSNTCTADGRFFYMAGGLEADFYFDNVRINYKA